MPVVALALFGVLLTSGSALVLLGARAARAARFRLFGDRRSGPEWSSGWTLLTGFTYAAAGPAAHLLGLMAPAALLDRRPVQVVGLVSWCAAAVLRRPYRSRVGPSARPVLAAPPLRERPEAGCGEKRPENEARPAAA